MMFKPIDEMWERVEHAKQDSDTAFFYSLMFMGEMLTKVVTSAFVAALVDDPLRYRYRHLHRLVRANGIGEWSKTLDDVLTGQASYHLLGQAKQDRSEFNAKCGSGTWQSEALELLNNCILYLDRDRKHLPGNILRSWFATFSELRNKTRGHGAVQPNTCSEIAPFLEQSLQLVVSNASILNHPWSYVRRNLSGKYGIIKLSDDKGAFDSFVGDIETDLPTGIYIHFEEAVRVELIETNADVIDFFFANGDFDEDKNTFELLSYTTGAKKRADATPYLLSPHDLPESETGGALSLEPTGKSFANLPPGPPIYINRAELEKDLEEVLVVKDRHPVVTLVGRGGIGKTSLALSVLHRVARMGIFEVILWFSARDIDLLEEGPKHVKPQVLTEEDIANQFASLMGIKKDKAFNAKDYLRSALRESPTGAPMLFVFDNFETVRNPKSLFSFIDEPIRSPNKVLITTRQYGFNGDFEVEVGGMNLMEANALIDQTAKDLGISYLLNMEYRRQLYREADGHPYVIKILLGEVAKKGELVAIERIMARKEDILNALFERIYAGLSPAAQRVFLALSSWRSVVPQLAIEAVLYSRSVEKIDVEDAIKELERSSFIEIAKSKQDGEQFVSVPMVASFFGMNKLEVRRDKQEIEGDIQLLHSFGAMQPSEVRHGLAPRIIRVFNYIRESVLLGNTALEKHLPMLHFIAASYPSAWLMIADLHEELSTQRWLEAAVAAVERYLQSPEEEVDYALGWDRMARLRQESNDIPGELDALVRLSRISTTPFDRISQVVWRANHLLYTYSYILEPATKQRIGEVILDNAEGRLSEADATFCSRLAMLCLTLRNDARARHFTVRGLQLDPHNYHCKKLATKMGIRS